jgi:hypothetical protein
VSVSLRNQRWTRYTLTETTVDGVPTKSYHLSVTRWARLVPPSGMELTAGLGAEHRVDGILVFSEEVTVSEHDVWLDEDDQVYEVRAVVPRKMRAEWHVPVERSTQADGTYYLVES